MKTFKLLSIDAWRGVWGGWDWNNLYHVGDVDASIADAKPRKLLAYLRQNGYLTPASAGKVAIDDDGYNLVIVAKGTKRPLYAIEYGVNQ